MGCKKMKNKLLIICAIILFSLTSACSCSNKKSVDDKKIQKIGVFEVKETKTENVDSAKDISTSILGLSELVAQPPRVITSSAVYCIPDIYPSE